MDEFSLMSYKYGAQICYFTYAKHMYEGHPSHPLRWKNKNFIMSVKVLHVLMIITFSKTCKIYEFGLIYLHLAISGK